MKFDLHLIACAASALLGSGIAHATDTNSPTPIATQHASHPTGAAASSHAPTSQMAREIDVTSNLWEVDATKAATDWPERIQRVR